MLDGKYNAKQCKQGVITDTAIEIDQFLKLKKGWGAALSKWKSKF